MAASHPHSRVEEESPARRIRALANYLFHVEQFYIRLEMFHVKHLAYP